MLDFDKIFDKKTISLFLLFFFLFAVASASSRININAAHSIKLLPKKSSEADKKIKKSDGMQVLKGKQYTGIITPIVVETISSGTDAYFYGTVERVARVGSIIKPQITDMEGNVVIEGTIVMQQGTKYWKEIVEGNKESLVASKQNLKTATENIERYKKLSKDGARSVQSFQAYQKKYFDAIGEYERNKGRLLFNQRMLETRTQVAPFEGIVTKVLFIMGRASGNPQTVELTQLNPIGIKIKMPREEASKINSNTPITLFSTNKKHKQGVFNGHSILCDDGVILITENYPQMVSENNSLPEVRDCYSVDNFYINNITDKTLGIPENALIEAEGKYYVLKAKDRTFLDPGKGLNPTFNIEKVDVIPGDLTRLHAGFTYIRSLKDPGSLKEGDLVLTDRPKGLKNGDKVNFLPERYVLMPNESVIVIIGE